MIELTDRVQFEGMLGGKNASAVSMWRGRALIVSDEVTEHGNILQVFQPDGNDFTSGPNDFIRLDSPGSIAEEMDLEGIAIDGDTIYVCGSHSSKRKKVDPDKKYVRNRAALMSPPEMQRARDVLLCIELDDDGRTQLIGQSSLRSFLNAEEPFRSFGNTASKENGIDVEGLAFFKGNLYAGFRGPVLRGNFTPVLRFKFGSPIEETQLMFLDLGGRGIRDLAHTQTGLLILAGPVGDGPGTYQLYFWEGRDGVPGSGSPGPGLKLLGDVPLPTPEAKPEGIATLAETPSEYNLLMVFDGLANGHASRVRVRK